MADLSQGRQRSGGESPFSLLALGLPPPGLKALPAQILERNWNLVFLSKSKKLEQTPDLVLVFERVLVEEVLGDNPQLKDCPWCFLGEPEIAALQEIQVFDWVSSVSSEEILRRLDFFFRLSRNQFRESRIEILNERENFRNLFRQTPEMVCILSGPEHYFEFVNDAHIKALGFDATGKNVREAQPESV